jgi:hypothetical protein
VRHTGNAKTKLAGSVVWPARWCFTLAALAAIMAIQIQDLKKANE